MQRPEPWPTTSSTGWPTSRSRPTPSTGSSGSGAGCASTAPGPIAAAAGAGRDLPGRDHRRRRSSTGRRRRGSRCPQGGRDQFRHGLEGRGRLPDQRQRKHAAQAARLRRHPQPAPGIAQYGAEILQELRESADQRSQAPPATGKRLFPRRARSPRRSTLAPRRSRRSARRRPSGRRSPRPTPRIMSFMAIWPIATWRSASRKARSATSRGR